ncbi:MAG: hypothetical protein ACO3ZK_18115, partial [Rubrivivax sp.]
RDGTRDGPQGESQRDRGDIEIRATLERQVVAGLKDRIGRHQPAGTADHGGAQGPEWFDAGVKLALESLQDPAAHLVVHCHMGINRGPSMALALLLAQGRDVIEALDAIRAARPLAAVIYAPDALAWWHARRGTPGETAADIARVRAWFDRQDISLSTVARLIRAVR